MLADAHIFGRPQSRIYQFFHLSFQPQQAQEIRERLERFGNFRDLFDHLQECTHRSAEKLKYRFDRRHHQQREII